MDIKEVDILGDDTNHWYYNSKGAAIRSLLRFVSPREILYLGRTAKAAGLNVIKSRYFFSAIFPLAAALRMLGRSDAKSSLKRHSVIVNKLLVLVHRLELPSINRMFGLTAFCLAQKPPAGIK